MARKTPPNAPCPCGSGKKYKRCCRPALLANNAPQKTEEEQRWEALLRAPENSLRLSASPWFVAAGLPQGAPESWLTLAHTALQRVQPALAMEALRQLPALTLSPREHWRAASLWWDCQEPANAHVHLLQTSPEHSDERSYWKLALDLHVALEQWQEALQAGQFLRSSNPGPETWWKLLLAAAQSGSRAHFCQLCEEAAERTGQHLWYILEANALAAWEQHEAAAALYKDHLEAALGEPAHRFGPLEQALIQATRAQTTYAPDDLQDRSRLLCARHLREEDLLKQRIEFCVQLDLWPSITEDARQWLVLDQDSLEARFFLTFSSLMQQTITPQEWQALLHLASTELFPVSLWNWFLLRLLLHRLHREAWALLQPLEARDPEQTRMLRMIILSQQGQFPQLVAELRPHVEDMAPDSFLLLLWGQGLLRTGKTRECIEVLVPFWETSSGEHRVSYSLWLAEAALVEEQTDLAGKFLAGVESLPAEERPPVFWYLSGLLKTQQGNASEASDDYLELVKRVQEPWAIEVAIPSLFLSGRAVEAKTLLEDWEGRLPMHDQLWYALLLAR